MELTKAFLKALILAYVVFKYVVEEIGEPVENYQPWTADHFPVTCLYPGSNLGSSDDKRVLPLHYLGPNMHHLHVI